MATAEVPKMNSMSIGLICMPTGHMLLSQQRGSTEREGGGDVSISATKL